MTRSYQPPVCIGGLGGSGTRVASNLLIHAGFHMGHALNKALDNIWFSMLFRRVETMGLTPSEFDRQYSIFHNAMTGREPFNTEDECFIKRLAGEERGPFKFKLLGTCADTMLDRSLPELPTDAAWGWKEPNTHIVIDRILKRSPGLTYIHVVRNGLDMAYSDNQNQLKLWARLILGNEDIPVTPRNSLKFWRAAHQRLLDMEADFEGKLYFLNYDQLCITPREEIDSLFEFLELPREPGTVENLTGLVRPADTIGRHMTHDKSAFDPEDIEFVRQFGFDVEVR